MRRALLAASLAALFLPAATEASFTQEPGSPVPVGVRPVGVLTADFNGDGRPDVVSLDETTVSVLLRRPTGGFVQETGSPIPIGPGPSGGAVADFIGDSLPDVAVSNFLNDNNDVAILQRNAGGGFSQPAGTPIDLVGRPSSIAAGDFDGDGDTDFAVPIWDSPYGVTLVLRGAGGVYTPAPGTLPTGVNPRSIVAADLDSDGDTDLAVTNAGSSSVTVLLRQSGGFTQEGSPISVGAAPHGILARDFNSDGVPDIVTANQVASSVSVLLRTVTGFTSDGGSPVPTDLGATGVDVADFDADTRPDLAVGNYSGNSVTILLNTTPFPPAPPPANLDADGDGVQRPFDCDDANPAIRPGAVDTPGDRIDQDCRDGDAPYPLLARRVVAFLDTYPTQRYTVFTSIAVKPVRTGDRLRLTCRGRGCPLKKKTVRVKKDKRSLSLLRYVRGAKLRKGAVVRLRVTRPGTIGRAWTWKVRAPKRVKITARCLQPGAKQPGACPDS